MAAASSFLPEEQFQCSICLDIFTEPVSIPCGHNFCKACLTKHWKGSDRCQCPLCNEKFNKGLKLCVNTGFRDIVENFKTHHLIADNNAPVKPGQVPCDCCTGIKIRASKTCLVCLVSFCEAHLEPHKQVAALKRHKLTDPVRNLEDKICKKHNRILEFFCRTDQTRVCTLCTKHNAHDTVPLKEEYIDKKAQMGKEKVEVPEMKPKQTKKSQKMKVELQRKKKGKGGAKGNSVVSDQMVRPSTFSFPNDDPRRMSRYSYIPKNRGLSKGRFYYEVQVKGKTGWVLGVVSESLQSHRTFRPNPGNQNWIVSWGNNSCRCQHCRQMPVLRWTPERVMVFVDYEQGNLLFYDPDNAMVIYSVTGCKFSERLFLFYYLFEEVTCAQMLRRKFQEILHDPNSNFVYLFFFAFVVFALISYCMSENNIKG